MPKPFLRWAGGKRALAPQLLELFPSNYRELRYVEPFLGAGGMFLSLPERPKSALLADSNKDLMLAWARVQAGSILPSDVTDNHSFCQPEEAYYEARTHFNEPRTEADHRARAALFIYLNRTCFNGLCRYSKKTGFNVPWGKLKNPTFPTAADISGVQSFLATAELKTKHYTFTVGLCGRGDFIYCDPPYDGTFAEYNSDVFDLEDQRKLRNALGFAEIRGAKVMVSNADTPRIRQLFRGYYIHEIEAPRRIAANGNRAKARELVITNYPTRSQEIPSAA